MFSLRYNLTVQVVEQVQKYFGSKVYKTTIPRSIRISEAPSYGQPINFYEPKGKGSEAYMDLAIEFVKNNRPHEPKKARSKSASIAEQTKMLWKIKPQGEHEWQEEKEDLAAGWTVCLKMPPRFLSPAQR